MLLTVFLLATTCFLIGIGLLGFAYYPHSFYTLVPLTVMFFAAVIYLCITLYTVQNQLKFQTNFGIGKAEWFVDIKKIVNDSIYHDRTGEPLQDFVVKQASAVSGRAIFIAGLGQYGKSIVVVCLRGQSSYQGLSSQTRLVKILFIASLFLLRALWYVTDNACHGLGLPYIN